MNGVHWFPLYKITNIMNYVISRNLLDEYFCNLIYVQKMLYHPSSLVSSTLNLTFFVLFGGLCNFYLCILNDLLNFESSY